VVHLDASKAAVQTARENARLSGLENLPVRYIVDDCLTFFRRETLRNKNNYDGIILDPPAFGRGGGKKIWKLDRDMPILMAMLPDLLSKDPAFVLFTCHDLEWPVERMMELLRETVGSLGLGLTGKFEMGPMVLRVTSDSDSKLDAQKNELPLGHFVRWSKGHSSTSSKQ
jgi:23S rRNA (cytosine1962-C5)-methyltransferase